MASVDTYARLSGACLGFLEKSPLPPRPACQSGSLETGSVPAYARGFLDALGALGACAIMVDSGGRLIAVGYGAEALFSEFFRICNGRISGRRAKIGTAIHRLIGRAVALTSAERENECELLALPREFGHAVLVEAKCIPDRTGTALLVVLILHDLDRHQAPATTVLCKAFGLTAAEARLTVQICQGLGLRDICERMNVRVTTLRTQLASVFAKTQTSRQAELVGLIARLATVANAVPARSLAAAE